MRLLVPLCIGLLLGASACAPTMPQRARLVYGFPAADSVVGALPDAIELHFNSPLASGSAVVLDATGQNVAGASTVMRSDPRTLVTQLTGDAGGMLSVRWQSVAAGSQDAADGTFAFTVAAGGPTQPQLLVTPQQTDVQQQLSIDGSGFSAQTAIKLTIGDDGQALGSATTDANGAFSATVKVPPDLPFGSQPIWAREAGGATAAASVDVRWGGWPPLRVYTMAKPGPDHRQVTFTVVGRNRSDYVLEGVRVRLEVPPEAQVVSADDGARRDGDFLTWDIGILDRTGLEPRSAVLRADGPLVGKAHVEFRHRRPRGCVGDQCLPSFVDETYSESGSVTPSE